MKSYDTKIPFGIPLAFAITLYVKFEDKLEAEIEMTPFEGLILMKLIGSVDPEFKAFSREYDKVGVAVAPERHTCVAYKEMLTYLEIPLT